MTFTKRMQFPSSWKSLLHFNFPVPYETGDAKKDEIGKLTWSNQGSPKFVGVEAWPTNAATILGAGHDVSGYDFTGLVVSGTPKFGWRCLQCASASDYITAATSDTTFDMVSTGPHEIDFWFRPTSVSGDNSVVTFLTSVGTSTTGLQVRQVSAKLKIITNSVWNEVNLATTNDCLTINTWHHVLVMVKENKVYLFVNATEVLNATISADAVSLPITNIRVGGCIGQIDEFLIKTSDSG